jgi:hypothetical protein
MSYNVLVTLTKTDTALPAGVVFGHTNLTVVDSANVSQAFALSGAETPPWSQLVAGLADGTSTYTAQDVDSNGAAIGAAVTTTYTPTVVTFPATSAITVTAA